jgi:hypothetical protein
VVDECLGELLPEVVKEYLLEFAEQYFKNYSPILGFNLFIGE